MIKGLYLLNGNYDNAARPSKEWMLNGQVAITTKGKLEAMIQDSKKESNPSFIKGELVTGHDLDVLRFAKFPTDQQTTDTVYILSKIHSENGSGEYTGGWAKLPYHLERTKRINFAKITDDFMEATTGGGAKISLQPYK